MERLDADSRANILSRLDSSALLVMRSLSTGWKCIVATQDPLLPLQRRLELLRLLPSVARAPRQIVVLGEFQSGKSTICKQLSRACRMAWSGLGFPATRVLRQPVISWLVSAAIKAMRLLVRACDEQVRTHAAITPPPPPPPPPRHHATQPAP